MQRQFGESPVRKTLHLEGDRREVITWVCLFLNPLSYEYAGQVFTKAVFFNEWRAQNGVTGGKKEKRYLKTPRKTDTTVYSLGHAENRTAHYSVCESHGPRKANSCFFGSSALRLIGPLSISAVPCKIRVLLQTTLSSLLLLILSK